MKNYSEQTFEAFIEETMGVSGWITAPANEFDAEQSILPGYALQFIQSSQPCLWAELSKLNGALLPEMLIKAIIQERCSKGTLHILRHGFKFQGKTLHLAYFKPAHAMSSEAQRLYGCNSFQVCRQVFYHPDKQQSIDMVLFLNGIPVATLELKNPGTGQSYHHAIKQYRADRDPGTALLSFKSGALVHFALDPDEVYMTTHLRKDKTFFLPFNRGSNPQEVSCGKGNPQHPSGHRTAYLWEEVLQPDSLLEIIGSFIFIENEGKKNETIIFPRYHQLDAVRALIAEARKDKAGKNYLIQHSAGSGKTNSISWLAHRLANLHTEDDKLIFDCVIVITDRVVLDRQLQDAIYQIEHATGVVKPIKEGSKQLAEALVDGTKIVISTLQKFPFILGGLLRVAGAKNIEAPDADALIKSKTWQKKIAGRRYAIIVDEAHSSQTGEAARGLKQVLGAKVTKANVEQHADAADQQTSVGSASYYTDSVEDWQDELNAIMESRGQQPNLSFFAFTATPKGKTLELFGRNGRAFHNYSMRQAIEEGFILDVLKRYTTYSTYFKLIKKVENDPSMPAKKAAKKLCKFMRLHPRNVSQKTEIIIEHFRSCIMPLVNGRAKAMVVTDSRLQAVRYMLSFNKYLGEHHYSDIHPLVAFSGTVIDPETELEYTEPGMNLDYKNGRHISETQLKDRFGSEDYQILLVANKYQTGYDQPLLCAMYVDKRLDGVQAVQTLSRLNRIYAGKEEPFVLDFVNKAEDILAAFKPYYTITELEAETDPGHLEDLKHELNQMRVYNWKDVESFAGVFYKPVGKQKKSDHAELQKYLQTTVDTFKAMEKDEDKEKFYDKLKAFVRLYAFVTQLISYNDKEQEMLYSYGRFLLPHLHLDRGDDAFPEKDVLLHYYRLQKVMEGRIDLADGEEVKVGSPNDVGTRKATEENKPLSEIIETLNDRFGTDFSEEDRLFFEQIKEKAIKNEKVIKTAAANPLDKFELGIQQIIKDLMMKRLKENDKIVSRYMDDEKFQKVISGLLAKEIYLGVKAEN
ncbi:MAG: restriction endonuclease subunit R [Candidatus Cloacimonetes bacterium HGW-Cloacimonetes-3]|jgi:type I restriction enzyme R subunit|nr:MAG: restriction endonuclease subunit R [Candidatus Cloacimonetes bacterium HGW-Cloacimonetes-3]